LEVSFDGVVVVIEGVEVVVGCWFCDEVVVVVVPGSDEVVWVVGVMVVTC
jgi:hypothetical protein